MPPEIDGVLVLRDTRNSHENFLWGLDTGTEISFPDRVYDVRITSISPNRELLACFDWYLDRLQVVTANGQVIFSYPAQENWWKITGWLDNERLAISTLQDDDGVQIIFNILTGEWQELPPTFPYASDDGTVDWFDPPEFDERDAVYDPTLSMAIIHRFSRDENRGTLELWNHQTKHLFWTETNVRVQSRPIWSSARKSFAIVYALDSDLFATFPSNREAISLFLISENGIATRLTNRVLGGATWSPDSRYIATLWQGPIEFDNWYEGAYAFAVTDIIDRKVTVYSIVSASGYHVWSPDGRYVALDNVLAYGDEPEETETRVVIVDLLENRAFEVARDARVVGWMAAVP